MPPDLAALVADAHARTLAAGSARISRRLYVHWEPSDPGPRRERGPVRDLASSVARQAGHRVAASVVKLIRDRPWTGFVDFDGHRSVLHPEREPGDAAPRRDRQPEEVGCAVGSTWWLIDALAGVVGAVEVGAEEVRGRPSRRLVARVDLATASAASPRGLAVPAADRFEELHAVPIDVWVHEGRLARLLYTYGMTHAVDLWDYGVDISGVDFSDGMPF